MKKMLFIAITSLVFISIVTIPVLADKASPKLALDFTDDSDNSVDEETNIILNNFVLASQKLLDKASPILSKYFDKSSPNLFGLDKSSPKLMKEWDSASPKLADYSKGWIDLAKNISVGSFSADFAGVDVSKPGTIQILSDGSTTSITSTLNLGEDMDQTIKFTYDENSGEVAVICRGAYCVHTR